ncbi:MAG: type II toxin-antitoxin system RelE/ParE family toxin [Bacteriovorax sp.]|nr:type II toxin-antitoxin system RelE/ParE family toxin [Rhizobacter sp.]
MRTTLHPGAEKDIAETAGFYEREGTPLLAARFVAEFRKLALILNEHPGIGAPRSRGRRGFSMSVFPYTVICRATQEVVRVLVVKHDRKRPGFGGSRT